MADTIIAVAGSIQLVHPFPNFDFADVLVFSTEVIAAILAVIVALFFFKFYRLSKFVYLLGVVVGFSFIAFSEALMASDVLYYIHPDIFNVIYWMRLVSLSYGFSFLAISYHYKHREEDRIPLLMRIGALSIIPVLLMIGLLLILPPTFTLPSYADTDKYFSAFNLVILVYVLWSSISSIIQQGRKEWIYIPSAYTFLLLGQYSALIYNLDGDASSFIAQQITKVIGLAIFCAWWYHTIRRKKVAKGEIER